MIKNFSISKVGAGRLRDNRNGGIFILRFYIEVFWRIGQIVQWPGSPAQLAVKQQVPKLPQAEAAGGKEALGKIQLWIQISAADFMCTSLDLVF